MKIGIVGAGIAGRLLAWEMIKKGFDVTLFDKNTIDSEAACSLPPLAYCHRWQNWRWPSLKFMN